MTQTKKSSFIEALVNTFIGLLITMIFSPIIYWICDVIISYPQMTLATILFTIISIIRNYIIRRLFNKKKIKDGNYSS